MTEHRVRSFSLESLTVKDITSCRTQVNCVNGFPGDQQGKGTRFSKWIANWLMAFFQSGIGMVHFLLALRKARYINLVTASSVGNTARFLIILRKLKLSDSIESP